jgi:ribosomal protein L11 methyltransferase
MMHWLEVVCLCQVAKVEALAELLTQWGALALTYTDASDSPILEPEPGTLPLWQHIKLIALFDPQQHQSSLHQALIQYEPTLNISFQRLNEQDWVKAVQTQFQPLLFGEQLWICPSWADLSRCPGIQVMLEPGLAFGTGTHPTTALCLKWLAAHPPNRAQVIDYGCGSGILALSAAKLGAAKVWAIDYDPQALWSTEQNQALNALPNTQLNTLLPQDLAPDFAPVDLLLANILANPLLELVEQFKNLVKLNGYVVLSGILAHQLSELTTAYSQYFALEEPVIVDGWARLSGQRIAA